MTNNRTKTMRALFWVFFALSLLANVAPIGGYTIAAFFGAGVIVEKVALCCSVLVVGILSLIAWVNKTTMRSRIWVILLALYFCLDNFIVPLVIIAITQILDEWIFSPLASHYRNKLIVNKEMDKRWNSAA